MLFFLANWFAEKFGLVGALLLRLLFLSLSLFLLYNLKSWPNGFYLISILSAAEIAFYWFTLHVVFAKSSKIEAMGDHISKLIALPSLVKLVVPLIGAGVSILFGFKTLFIFAGFIYVFSIIPFLFNGHIPIEVHISFSGIMDYARRYKRYFVAEFLLNMQGEIEGYVLPIFLFLTFHNVLSIGFLATFLSLGGAVFTLLIGKYSDRIDRKKILRAGAFAMMIIWIGFYFSINQTTFYALSALSGFLGALISVPFGSIFYIINQPSIIAPLLTKSMI